MTSFWRLGGIGLALIVLLLVGCGGGSERVSDPDELPGNSWTLGSGIDVDGWEQSRPTISFDQGQLGGSGGCNTYGADYSVDGSAMEIDAIVSTKIACPSPADAVEREFFSALEAVDEWWIEDGRLVLSGLDGELGFEMSASNMTGSWKATSLQQGDAAKPLIAETEITAEFTDDGELSGSAGCNTYGGSYRVEGSSLRIQRVAATERACLSPKGVMDQETDYLDLLGRVRDFTLQGEALTLLDANGRVLVTLQRSSEVVSAEAGGAEGPDSGSSSSQIGAP